MINPIFIASCQLTHLGGHHIQEYIIIKITILHNKIAICCFSRSYNGFGTRICVFSLFNKIMENIIIT